MNIVMQRNFCLDCNSSCSALGSFELKLAARTRLLIEVLQDAFEIASCFMVIFVSDVGSFQVARVGANC